MLFIAIPVISCLAGFTTPRVVAKTASWAVEEIERLARSVRFLSISLPVYKVERNRNRESGGSACPLAMSAGVSKEGSLSQVLFIPNISFRI